MMKKIGIIAAALTVALTTVPVQAKVTADEAAKLGTELTPLGGEKAGNAGRAARLPRLLGGAHLRH